MKVYDTNDVDATFSNQLSDLAQLTFSDAIPIPKGATNGDMIKAMFPYIKIHEHKRTDICDAYIQIDIWDFSICVSKDWWDAPYMKEE